MARSVVPLKLIISQDGSGTITEALLQYQINDSGVISNEFKTVSVKDALGDSCINSLYATAVTSANTSEGI